MAEPGTVTRQAGSRVALAATDASPSHSCGLSVVIPVFNEESNLRPLHRLLRETLDELDCSHEIIFIDDGSRDGSATILRQLEACDPCVRVMSFVRNFGQTAAMSAGFEHSRGDIIIPLDADLQNDPRDIPKILETLDQGFDVVSCWRRDRQDSWLRVLASRVANILISRISGIPLHDYGCTIKGYRRHIVRHIRLYGEMHRFIPIFANWAGARVTELPVRHHPRKRGESKYGMIRSLKVPLDLITIKFLESYSTKPMYLFGGMGFLSFLAGSVLSGITLYQKFFAAVKAHRNPVLLLSIFCFLVGIQFVLFGLMCELLVRTYHESQNKPTYILKESPERVGAHPSDVRSPRTPVQVQDESAAQLQFEKERSVE